MTKTQLLANIQLMISAHADAVQRASEAAMEAAKQGHYETAAIAFRHASDAHIGKERATRIQLMVLELDSLE